MATDPQTTITETLGIWMSRGMVGAMAPVKGRDAVTVLRRVLAKLSDQHPPPARVDLLFIKDEPLRNSIRADIGSAHRALDSSEWKPATVMAGAAVETILHWRLEQVPQATREAAAHAPKEKGGMKDLNDFGLHDYISVALDLKLLSDKTSTAAFLAKDFRNLIHPVVLFASKRSARGGPRSWRSARWKRLSRRGTDPHFSGTRFRDSRGQTRSIWTICSLQSSYKAGIRELTR